MLHVFDPFTSAKPKTQIPLPLWGYRGDVIGCHNYTDEMPYRAILNSYTDPPTIWMITGYLGHRNRQSWPLENFQRFKIANGKLVLLDTWNREVVRAVAKWQPPDCMRQRLLVDPSSGMLYSMEENRCVSGELIRIDPETGKVDSIRLPYHANEAAFDAMGHIFLRCDRLIGRFKIDGLREVPFDYGEERHAKWDSFSRGGKLISAIVLPGNRSANWYESGMGATPRGEVVVSAVNSAPRTKKMLGVHDRPKAVETASRKYVPPIFPGRRRYSDIHMFDKHGKPIGMDIAAQGTPAGTATLVDTRGDVYFHVTRHRLYNGKSFEPLTGCVLKFKRGRGRFLAAQGGEVALPQDQKPSIPPQVSGHPGGFWVQNAEWIYPGAGFSRDSAPCNCWNSAPALDLLDRVFIPQYIRGQVAVLDRNGNLILQVGCYGNVDDGVPLVPDKFRAGKPRSIGGDEVGLMYPNFVASHTDRRLFISDVGNSRIVSVKLGYHSEQKVLLAETPYGGDAGE
jgi:hypothetical protein